MEREGRNVIVLVGIDLLMTSSQQSQSFSFWCFFCLQFDCFRVKTKKERNYVLSLLSSVKETLIDNMMTMMKCNYYGILLISFICHYFSLREQSGKLNTRNGEKTNSDKCTSKQRSRKKGFPPSPNPSTRS